VVLARPNQVVEQQVVAAAAHWAGVPVVRVLRTIYDSQGQPVEVQDTVAAADRHRFRYEVNMGEAR
jgi:GntR family transcriptional regulator